MSRLSLYDSCQWVVLTLKYCSQPNSVGSQINIFENLPNDIWFVQCYFTYMQLLLYSKVLSMCTQQLHICIVAQYKPNVIGKVLNIWIPTEFGWMQYSKLRTTHLWESYNDNRDNGNALTQYITVQFNTVQLYEETLYTHSFVKCTDTISYSTSTLHFPWYLQWILQSGSYNIRVIIRCAFYIGYSIDFQNRVILI